MKIPSVYWKRRFNMAFIDAAIAVGTFVGWEGIGAGAAAALGGGILGAGAGGLYGGLTGGDVGKDMLMGAGLGAGGAYLAAPTTAGTLAAPTAAGTLAGGSAVPTAAGITGNAGLGTGTLNTLGAGAEQAGLGGVGSLTSGANLGGSTLGAGGYGSTLGATGSSIGSGTSLGLTTVGDATTAAGLGAGSSVPSGLDGLSKYLPSAKNAALLGGAGYLASQLGKQNTINAQPYNYSLPNYTGAKGVTPVAYRGAWNEPTPLSYPSYSPSGYADGGPIDSTGGGANTIEEMSRQNATGSNQMYPQANLSGLTGTNTYQNATNTPISNNMISSPTDTPTDPYTGAMRFVGGGDIGAIDQEKVDELVANAKTVEGSKELAMGVKANDTNALQAVQLLGQLNKIPQVQEVTNPALAGNVANPMASQVSQAGLPVQAAKGGIMNGVGTIGSYSDGGQMLKGPGDGMSDSIPAKIGKHQPARLADSEFVVPADVVSHLGNGSSDAGAKQLYAMMDRVRKARTGNKKQGKEIKPQKYMPA